VEPLILLKILQSKIIKFKLDSSLTEEELWVLRIVIKFLKQVDQLKQYMHLNKWIKIVLLILMKIKNSKIRWMMIKRKLEF